LQAVIDYISTKLQTIDGIDHVHQTLPYVQNKKELKEWFATFLTDISTPDNFQAWTVFNAQGIEVESDGGNIANWQDTISIHGFLKFDPTPSVSGQQMQQWIDAIKPLFLNNQKLGGTVLSRGPLRLVSQQPDWFSNYLTHHAWFDMTVQVILQ